MCVRNRLNLKKATGTVIMVANFMGVKSAVMIYTKSDLRFILTIKFDLNKYALP